jgi:hypothetical protein
MLDDGIRRHRYGGHADHPFAAWHFRPFWELLRTAPLAGLTIINRMLNHAATQCVTAPVPGAARRRTSRPTSGQQAALPDGPLSIPGVGQRHYVGDEYV